MTDFKKYRRTQISELRPVTLEEVELGVLDGMGISISSEDRINGSPKIGDMIARNPNNHKDQWLVAAKYFSDNFESLDVN